MAGVIDLLALRPGHPASRTASAHLVAMGAALTLFLGSLLVRGRPDAPAGAWALVPSSVGAVALPRHRLLGGRLGGQLVYRHGVGTAPAPRICDNCRGSGRIGIR